MFTADVSNGGEVAALVEAVVRALRPHTTYGQQRCDLGQQEPSRHQRGGVGPGMAVTLKSQSQGRTRSADGKKGTADASQYQVDLGSWQKRRRLSAAKGGVAKFDARHGGAMAPH